MPRGNIWGNILQIWAGDPYFGYNGPLVRSLAIRDQRIFRRWLHFEEQS